MPQKLTVKLSPERLQELNNRAKAAGVSKTEIARQFSPPMNMNYLLAKMRGDASFTPNQYKEVLRIIKAAEKIQEKIARATSL